MKLPIFAFERVHHEVNQFNRRQSGDLFQSLVQPAHAEVVLNGARSE